MIGYRIGGREAEVCPTRCWIEKKYREFPVRYKIVEDEPSLFVPRTTTTCGVPTIGGCLCRYPAS